MDAIEKYASSLNFHGADYTPPREHYKKLRAVAALENIFVEHGDDPLSGATSGEVNTMRTKYNKALGTMLRPSAFVDALDAHAKRRKLPTLTIPFVFTGMYKKKQDAENWGRKVLESTDAHHAM